MSVMNPPLNNSPFKNDVLKGKVAFITGGGTGICFGIAKVFGQHGCKLALMGRREFKLKEACAELGKHGIEAIGCQGDVTKQKECVAAMKKAADHFGRIDILINGAAGNFICAAEDLSVNGFRRVQEIDSVGTFAMSRAALPYLKERRGSLIVNITATLHKPATNYQIHVCAAKAGVDATTRVLALEWAKHGIRVNGVAPGPIGGTEGMKRLALPGFRAQDLLSKRMGTPTEIGHACVFLACSPYISGEIITVDGGQQNVVGASIPQEVYEQFRDNSRKLQLKQKAKREAERRQRAKL